jgi:hypothetical protein
VVDLPVPFDLSRLTQFGLKLVITGFVTASIDEFELVYLLAGHLDITCRSVVQCGIDHSGFQAMRVGKKTALVEDVT